MENEKYFKNFFEEKEINNNFEVEGSIGTNFIPKEVVFELIINSKETEQTRIKNILIEIDFRNGDINHFFNHILQGVAQ